MWGRLLTKAAVLLATVVVSVAMANEPGTDVGKFSKIGDAGIGETSSSGQPAKTDSLAKPTLETARNPRVVLITSKESEPCRRELEKLSAAGGVFASMRSQGWKIGSGPENHVQIIDEHSAREFVELP